ncbi:hypothetical protein Osc1_23140 [Hominimerdicola sp. 21CYCFAH17_S]
MNFSFKLTKSTRILNILIAIQLAVVFALIIIMLSALKDRTVYYSQFEEALSQNGICIMPNIGKDDLKYDEDILRDFDKATAVTGGKANLVIMDSDDGSDKSGYINYYSQEIMKELPPYLKEGKLPDADSEIPQCVVCDNFGYKTGDIVELKDWDGVSFKIQISGIMSDYQYIYGTGGPDLYNYTGDFRNFYYQLNSAMRSHPLFISTDKIMDKVGSKGCYNFYSLIIVNFPEGAYSKIEIENMTSELGYRYYYDTDYIYEKSEQYVNQELYTLFPIALSILIITIFTAIITTVVTTTQNLRSYAVLYLCGATWKRCSVINFINYIIVVIFTIFADALFFIIGKYTFLKQTVITISVEYIGICAIILALFLLLSIIIPLLVVRNKQPRDVLKTEFRN